MGFVDARRSPRSPGNLGVRPGISMPLSNAPRTRLDSPLMTDTHVVVLAAGQGTRMKSQLPKVLHQIAGRPMIEHVLHAARAVTPSTVTVIVGHRADLVRERLSGVAAGVLQFALQEPQRGTAHALQQAEPALAGHSGTVILLSGDVPLLRAATLQRLLD